MASRQQSDRSKPRLFDTISAKYQEISEQIDPAPAVSNLLINGTAASIVSTAALGMLMAAQPVAAQTQELGQAVCGSGAGWAVSAIFILAAVYLMGKGAGRLVQAIDDMGSVDDQKRGQGRREIKGAAVTFGGGLVGVPFVGAFLGRVLPESFSCIGFDMTFLVIAGFPF